jgi:hypothetical protein
MSSMHLPCATLLFEKFMISCRCYYAFSPSADTHKLKLFRLGRGYGKNEDKNGNVGMSQLGVPLGRGVIVDPICSSMFQVSN